jgi:YbbR domain-containing protein
MNRFFNLVTHNFWYKVAALALAVLIWAIVQGEEILELNRKVSIKLQVPDNHIVREDPLPQLDATIRGPRILMGDLLNRKELNATIKLGPNDKGELRLRISKDNFSDWDERISLTIHEPASISVLVDEKATERIPIREVLQGAPADGYIIEKVTLKPKSIEVTGLRSELRKVKEIITEPIDITGIKQSKTLEAAIVSHGLSRAELSESITSVALQVGESKVNRRFSGIPVTIVGAEYGAQVRPKYVTIEVQGTPGVLSFIKPSDLRAMVDVTNLGAGRYDREIQVKIPAETALIETSPDKVSVQVSENRSR